MTALLIALAVAVALLSVLVLGLLRSHADILRALHSLGVELDPSSSADSTATSVPAPTLGPVGNGMDVPSNVSGVDPEGGVVSVSLRGEGRLTLLAFLSSGCLTCRPMWEALDAPGVDLPGGARPVVVTKSPEQESPSSVRALMSGRTTVVMSSDAWEALAVPGSPYFVLVDGSGAVIGEGTAGVWERVVELFSQALADADQLDSKLEPPRRPPARQSGAERLRHVDETLRAAGIEQGHPSLHPEL